jgi:hypothetical protein
MSFARVLSLTLVLCFLVATPAYAQIEDIGFFGGISQGTRLPKTTETLLANQSRSSSRAPGLPYKEVVLLDGTPRVFEGTLTVTTSGKLPEPGTDMGTYTQTYSIVPSIRSSEGAVIRRRMVFRVNWRREGNQIIKDYALRDATRSSWDETIELGGSVYRLDHRLSSFNVSILEDETPGGKYYKGNVSNRAVYTDDGEANTVVRLETVGSFYGYSNPWSSTDVQRLDGFIDNSGGWQMQYQVRPSVSVSKKINYSANEPELISFAGNYQEIMQNVSGASYNIYMRPTQFYQIPTSGNINQNNTNWWHFDYYEDEESGDINLAPFNTFEQLIAPDLTHLRGHPAESDISKLFAMQVLDGDPRFYQPNQAITRDQYVTALAKALKLPIEQVSTGRGRNAAPPIVFPDVQAERPTYPYIMAAYRSGLISGNSQGLFNSDRPIERQEAMALMLRALGLQQLGLNPTPVTPFVDDADIALWAKRELYAAHRIGLIYSDDNGRINPRTNVSKAEAAAFINRLIDYMREDIAEDYAAHIVNFPN